MQEIQASDQLKPGNTQLSGQGGTGQARRFFKADFELAGFQQVSLDSGRAEGFNPVLTDRPSFLRRQQNLLAIRPGHYSEFRLVNQAKIAFLRVNPVKTGGNCSFTVGPGTLLLRAVLIVSATQEQVLL